jgi:hypothetical protein
MEAAMNATDAGLGAPTPRRRVGRWLLIGVAVLALLVIAVVVAARVLIDPARYRQTIEQALTTQTGWAATVGEMSLSWRSGLALSASRVKLSSPSQHSSIEIAAVDVTAPLGPLFRGELQVQRVVIVQPHAQLTKHQGVWEVPKPNSSAASRSDPAGGASAQPARWSIAEIEVKGGAVQLHDPEMDPGGRLAVEQIAALYTASTGRIWGQARFGAGAGKLSWQGTLEKGLDLDVESASGAILSAWFGRDAIRPAGTFQGSVRMEGWNKAKLQGRGDGLVIFISSAALPPAHAALEWSRANSEAPSSLHGTIDLGGLRFRGGGQMTPQLAMRWRIDNEPIDEAIAALSVLGPLPLQLEGPGTIAVDAEVREHNGKVTVHAAGRVSAKRVRINPSIPTLDAMNAQFRLDPDLGLTIAPLTGKLAKGNADLQLHLAPVSGQGKLTARGRVAGIDLPTLLKATGTSVDIPGSADADLDLSLDLSQGSTIDGLTGTVQLQAQQLILPAWKQLGDEATRLDRLDALLIAAPGRWKLSGIDAVGPALHAVGSGSFEPNSGAIELPLQVRLTAASSQRLIERVSALRHLQSGSGEVSVAGKVSGTLAAPRITFDLEKSLAASGKSTESVARDLIGDYLKKKQEKNKEKSKPKDKKKKKKPTEPEAS